VLPDREDLFIPGREHDKNVWNVRTDKFKLKVKCTVFIQEKLTLDQTTKECGRFCTLFFLFVLLICVSKARQDEV